MFGPMRRPGLAEHFYPLVDLNELTYSGVSHGGFGTAQIVALPK